MIRFEHIATSLCLIAFAFLALTGCGAIEYAIEKDRYESTREEGTRHKDSRRLYVYELGPGTYRITYTCRVKGFDRSKGFESDKAQRQLDRKAAEIALQNGYTHFSRIGQGQTGREGVVMTKMLIKCYGKDGGEIPPEAIDASTIK